MILKGSFYSQTLEMETGLSVLVPNSSLTRGNHSVVYLLHGLCGRNEDWIHYSMLPVYAERFDCVFIMPEVARSFYTDMAYGQHFFRYITQELPAVCASVFQVSSRREETYVMGTSMGGYGALKCALTYPETYGGCAAFSSPCLFLKEGLDAQRDPANRPYLEKTYGCQLLNDFEAAFGPDLTWKPEHDILALAAAAAQQGTTPRIYAACGTQDPMYQENKRFEGEMKRLGLDFSFEVWDGEHNWTFFNSALEKALGYFFEP
ncbi:alpha/beta hydrolase [Desulfoluna butyratoxydans]|uniref:Alpha/beta hydrolase fold n=1 Tax=Desulfoluna butyratoxydans TaxID=231438 RepID=A0A4U8YJI1_9BACT|nr:alpha/beta hydrolase-fold protein [Desulfoluna butyratoxydans]VFQ43916.1 alpha/beta hydrolase fold [Desulfoluna butyratoxydans]